MVSRVLIANRGEIALRIERACRELGIDAVVAVTGADRGGLVAEVADDVAEVATYLDAEALVEAARSSGCDAVHPGYGFLSEDPRFAEAVLAAGVAWVGPPPEAMRSLGDKIRARELAAEVGVPVVPGASGTRDEVLASARALGAPLLVKAAAGGGGRGMRAVEHPDDLEAAIEAASREAGDAFGDDRVFVERRFTDVRHVEVQVLLDVFGAGVHLGERDCSVQRRHQKVIEEAPSPSVDEALRQRLGTAALSIAARAGYVGAGTVEFLLLPDGSFAFLEMNARLQVEHPVTEAVTGLDLVRAQFEIASGAALGLRQDDVAIRGHAIEARLYAEDPSNGFLPSTGRAERVVFPRWPGVRVDAALREGDDVGLGFDPLLAKVIASDRDRPSALRRLRAALEEVVFVGLPTNLGFLLDVLDAPEMREGSIGTDWVAERWQPRVPSLPDGVRAARRDASDPWLVFGESVPAPDGVVVGDAWAQYRGWAYRLHDDLTPVTLPPPAGSLTAPMPATVRTVHVGPGQRVDTGETVVVLEAMKMQMAVVAPAPGTITVVHVHEGDVVAAGAVLVEVVDG